MQVNITTRHGQLSAEDKQWIENKVQRLLRYFSRIMAIEVTVELPTREKTREKPHVELLVSAEHKHDFVAKAQADTLYSALDDALAKMEQQLRKYKSRLQDHRPSEPTRPETTSESEEESAD